MKSSPAWAVVVKSALLSRVIVVSLIILWRTLLRPYDTSAPLNPDCIVSNITQPEQQQLWPSVSSAIKSSVVWDSVYFIRIARCGYEYEQTYAFLPLLPISTVLLAQSLFAPLVPLLGHTAVLALSGYLINNVAFVFAAFFLYKLSFIVLKDHDSAIRAAILFCFNPASIFYSSIYSESLYALFSIGGLYYLISGNANIAVVWLAFSGLARSNGVISAGYICFQTMHRAYDAMLKNRILLAMQVIAGGVVRSMFVFAPFLAFQAYGYRNICVGDSPDRMRPWCKARVPLLYSYIQSHYWGVGFLRYFQFKQLPNFLLASPILSLALCSIVHYAKSEPRKFFSLGFQASSKDKNSAAVFFVSKDTSSREASSKMRENFTPKQNKKTSKGRIDARLSEKHESSSDKTGYLSVFVLPFILHLGFLSATAFFVMHVQVSTRFLSSSPPIYWFATHVMKFPSGRRWGCVIWAYSAAYILLGSLLFPNFYPFT